MKNREMRRRLGVDLGSGQGFLSEENHILACCVLMEITHHVLYHNKADDARGRAIVEAKP